jgi:hypothetical protein
MEPRIGRDDRDEHLTRALKDIYARPDDVHFWDALQRRVLARLDDEELGWWQPFREWVQYGLVAAGLSALAAGLVLGRARATEARVAYETVIETPRTLPQQLATKTVDLPPGEATLQYLIEP